MDADILNIRRNCLSETEVLGYNKYNNKIWMVTGQLHCPVETMAIMCVVIIMLITQMHSDFNEGDVCSSEDKIQAAGPWRDGDEGEDDFIMISETITTRSGRVASRFSTVILH